MGPSSLADGFGRLAELERLVASSNACALPGCTIVFGRFLDCMWRAVSRGYVHTPHAKFVQEGLMHGFDLGFDASLLRRRGRVVHRPYSSALDNMAAVAKAVMKRVDAGKTLVLGEWQKPCPRHPF